ncbi:MAG: hypothetical protein L0H41_15775, partial [Microlunatus sp.]|nr:hypothetical protein [Microlunatus sp.]
MTGPLDVLVAIPAHDEQESIGRCLDSVRAAVIIAQQAGVVGRARLAVAAHRCVDETVARVRQWLVEHPGTDGLLVEDVDLKPVGAVRTELITTAMSAEPVLSPGCWILSTDADSIVPPGWITGLLAAARSESADLVAGLADLDAWTAPEGARRVYAEIVDAGIVGRQHRHVYAANLAVSWRAFQAVGGFPAVAHGEEHGLAAAVRASGRRVVSPLGPRVRTSARMPGRAAEGL